MSNWESFAISLQGTSHIKDDIPCQDYCLNRAYSFDGEHVFVGVLADGAGSASHGGLGAKIACETLLRAVADWIDETTDPDLVIERPAIETWLQTAHDQMSKEAHSIGASLRDFACTLLGCVAVKGRRSCYFQIGDGGIVSCNAPNKGYQVIFWPQNGEYANTTFFLSDENFLQTVMIATDRPTPDEITLFSDGLQDLLLDSATQEAHQPFFRKVFQGFRSSRQEVSDIRSNIENLLKSPLVIDRTDDDISLVMAIGQRTDV